ncbi:bifunctional phosphopantothenoylcysteine decarboxylase/phosphopantothenate--cysteine ligase CoaBC [Gilvimarinus agarilyticus]|uniref:bifunctional phosphopantothenoylcysteine decarboxylase/phosphopantothenate--cysteine ligase CoaBC n=1 Tax=Gilvimarinus sp. 2_MG-2023 TaxID=3062666 RepID=UPI001C0A35D5|nr:bifunctional phosphopantothenoylcysteine decarboxylase/phosphopantothenate--cysteine ligase CoaBC [Gilvimarinus sp. 2_MG-2023]MBU2884578.1 bifunctional phosphopantothenoylcysteine decarboxylase/phosphopantothenate--cysteine ligase CoaBC [Gilvimarinus agarilyticus]MDO6569687.1 bifunctional phosphopantothenoylcysteine decarboxylase/phosphopantothenate--cysteine ligase CoaBC [Gilvimarinus sp. 2_MG-2023]
MSTLQNKRILLGVTGGIAAYKSAELIRGLREQGAEVVVVMTQAAQEFITPLTLQALSGNPVHTSLLDPAAEAAMGHIELARWADRILVAPASADFMARLAGGMGNDLLTTLCLATRAPVMLAPAMNQAMWDNPTTQYNLTQLQSTLGGIYGPGSGSQACGEIGPGRMLEPLELVEHLAASFKTQRLTGQHVVITAGPTREPLDPVRYLSNYSSGKMGYALANAAIEAGAQVTLISGPCQQPTPERVNMVMVQSAEQMLDASLTAAANADIFIGAAAVCDYRPMQVSHEKLKKQGDGALTLTLTPNPDIIATVAQRFPNIFTAAFAAETENLLKYARAKRLRKGVHCIIANDVSDQSIGFNSDQNAVTLIDGDSETQLDQRSKTQLARDLINLLAQKNKQAKDTTP